MTNKINKNEIELQVANASLFSLSIYRFGDRAGADMDELTTSADKEMMGAFKKLFAIRSEDGKVGENKQWTDVKGVCNDLYVEVNKRTMPVYTFAGSRKRSRKGLRIINVNKIVEIEALIKKHEQLLGEALNKFATVYPALIENAKVLLNGQFRSDDYPSIDYIKSRFGFGWSYLQFGSPANLPKEVMERELASTVAANKATAEECRLALRQGLLSLVDHLTDVLTPDAKTGKRKKFYESNLEKIVEFQKLLEFTDLTNDSELRLIADKAREMVSEATPEDIKLGGKVTEKVMNGAKEIGEALRTMVGEVKGRKFDFGGDGE